ncbi:50S ribosomal protein L17 [Candidatus Roizmanbacteria bacterium]|nr:50S ribosomal protein L17 [Candidatus Roizmanbacteria bacterium]
MRHGVKKNKFKKGVDAGRIVIRHLVTNFVREGKIVTTITKAKALKSYLDKLANKSKTKNEANRNYLMAKIGDARMVKIFFEQIGPVIKDKSGGYTRIIKLGRRLEDGVETAKVEWAYPVVLEKKAEVKREVSQEKVVETKKKK